MRRFFYNIVIVFIIVLLLYVPLYWTIVSLQIVYPQPSSYHYLRNTEIKFNEIKNYHDVDVLFVGGSNAYRSFDTRLFLNKGLYTFNMGTSAQTPIQSYLLLRQFIDSIRPSYVVMAVSPMLMTIPTESTLDFIWSDFEDDKIQWEIIKFQMSLACKDMHTINTWIFNAIDHNVCNAKHVKKDTYLNIIRHIEGEEMIIDSLNMYIRGGYVERMGKLNNIPQRHEPVQLKINAMQLYYLRKCADLLNSKNIPFVFVETPIQEACYTTWENHKEWEKELKKLNIYLNYNERPIFNDSIDFYDSYHMNKYGVAKFDSIFIIDIEPFLKTYSTKEIEK